MAKNQTNAMSQQQDNTDTDFRDIWNYLKWLRRAYDIYAKASGNPTVGQYGRQAWDWGKEKLFGNEYSGTEAYPTESAAGELGATSAGAGATSGEFAATGAASAGDVGLTAGTGAASFGEGGAGLSAGGAASLAAPLVMAYLKYQAGSGRNEPVEKRIETLGTIPLIKQLNQGVDVDPKDYWDKFRQQPKYSAGSTSIGADQPGWTMPKSGKYSIGDLWHSAHYMGKGHGGQPTGDSGLSDTQIDDMILNSGVTLEDLLKALKLDQMPDWNKYSYDTWYANTFKPDKEFDSTWL